MKCNICKSEITKDDKFCGNCGSEINSEDGEVQKFMTQQEIKLDDVRSNLGMVYFRMGKYDEALECYKKILEQNPDNLSAKTMIEIISKERNN